MESNRTGKTVEVVNTANKNHHKKLIVSVLEKSEQLLSANSSLPK